MEDPSPADPAVRDITNGDTTTAETSPADPTGTAPPDKETPAATQDTAELAAQNTTEAGTQDAAEPTTPNYDAPWRKPFYFKVTPVNASRTMDHLGEHMPTALRPSLMHPTKQDICSFLRGPGEVRKHNFNRLYFCPVTYPPPKDLGKNDILTRGIDLAVFEKLKDDLRRTAIQAGFSLFCNGGEKGNKCFRCGRCINRRGSKREKEKESNRRRRCFRETAISNKSCPFSFRVRWGVSTGYFISLQGGTPFHRYHPPMDPSALRVPKRIREITPGEDTSAKDDDADENFLGPPGDDSDDDDRDGPQISDEWMARQETQGTAGGFTNIHGSNERESNPPTATADGLQVNTPAPPINRLALLRSVVASTASLLESAESLDAPLLDSDLTSMIHYLDAQNQTMRIVVNLKRADQRRKERVERERQRTLQYLHRLPKKRPRKRQKKDSEVNNSDNSNESNDTEKVAREGTSDAGNNSTATI